MRFFPKFEKNTKKDPAPEFGVTGLKQRDGVLAEEFLPELRGSTGRKIYAEMRDNDPTIGALLSAIELMLRAVIKKATGKFANVAVMGYDVYKILKDHPDIAARLQYGGNTNAPAKITREALASLFDLDELHVMGAVEETAAEGDASSMAFVNRNKVLLVHRPKAPGFQVASAGYLFSWQGYTGLESPDIALSSFYMPQLKSDRYEGEVAVDAKVTGTDLGVLMSSVVA